MCTPGASGLSAQAGGQCGRRDRRRTGLVDQRERRLDRTESLRAAHLRRVHEAGVDRDLPGRRSGDLFVVFLTEIYWISSHSQYYKLGNKDVTDIRVAFSKVRFARLEGDFWQYSDSMNGQLRSLVIICPEKNL